MSVNPLVPPRESGLTPPPNWRFSDDEDEEDSSHGKKDVTKAALAKKSAKVPEQP